MKNEDIKAIHNFFKAVEKLQELGIVRSSKYLGDIGEFLASRSFSLKLTESQRQKHIDAQKKGKKYQIKFHNAQVGTNINIGDPTKYDFLIIVIGPKSKIREDDHNESEFRIYLFKKKEIMKWSNKSNKGIYVAKTKLENCSQKYQIK